MLILVPAWRAVEARGYLFIHCLWIYAKANRGKGFGSALIGDIFPEAKSLGKTGVAAVRVRPRNSFVEENGHAMGHGEAFPGVADDSEADPFRWHCFRSSNGRFPEMSTRSKCHRPRPRPWRTRCLVLPS
jgi:GNAT superfamily N-acetyltransferase